MHIGIDARLYGLEHAGIGRYIINFISALLRLDSSHQYTLFLRSKYFFKLNFPSQVTKVLADIPHYSLKEQWQFYHLLNRHNLDLVHFPHFNVPLFFNRPFLVTIHDLLWHQFQGLTVTTLSPPVYLIKYLGYKAVVNHALHASRAIMVPSQWVKSQLTSVPTDKISVIYEGVDSIFFHPPKIFHSSLLPQLKRDIPYIIYTGSAYPHKNLRLLIKAVKIVNQTRPLQLVIISSRSVFLNQLDQFVNHQHLNKLVFFAGYVADAELINFYSAALALVQPSLSEGFGLTGIEAMATGLPVLAARSTALPEIYADAALYFNPTSIDDLTDKLLRLLSNKPLCLKLKRKGQHRARQFSWDNTASQTLRVYNRLTANLHIS